MTRSPSLARAVSMMIGYARRGRARPQQPAHVQAVQHRQVQVENDEVRRLFGGEPERLVAAGRDLDRQLAAPLQGVANQAGDIPLVFDDEHSRADRLGCGRLKVSNSALNVP